METILLGVLILMQAVILVRQILNKLEVQKITRDLEGLLDDAEGHFNGLIRDSEIMSRDIRNLEELVESQARIVGELEVRLDKHDAAANGFWRTAPGDTLRVRDMSTNHLRNCLAMRDDAMSRQSAPPPALAMKMEKELKRREIDATFKSAEDFVPAVQATIHIKNIRRVAEQIEGHNALGADISENFAERLRGAVDYLETELGRRARS